jgi:hypothetical protein
MGSGSPNRKIKVETTQKSIGSVSIEASAKNTEKDLVLFVLAEV